MIKKSKNSGNTKKMVIHNNNLFNCKNINHVLAEIFYIIANGFSSQENYTASNFYLNLAKYLNPKFLSL